MNGLIATNTRLLRDEELDEMGERLKKIEEKFVDEVV
jgi:hypothetical protein